MKMIIPMLAGLALPSSTAGVELPRGFVADTLATNLHAMTAMALPPDGRIFLADQTGKLLVWKEGRLLERPALTVHVTDYWERGLIGLTLHPDFPRTPHLFVLYVTDRPFVHHVLSRFTINGDTADPDSEVVLLEGDDQAALGGNVPAGHQGGPLRFGNDGKLYIGIGEQTAGAPSQQLGTFQGKILRINPDGSIPRDNPFWNEAAGKYRAIWAYGVRNPFGLAMQRETGRIFFTDVGGSAFEEVNELIGGANYGWPRAEGYSKDPELKSPLYAYPPVVGSSICGGTFYPLHGGTFPAKWTGKFFFVDYINPWLKALDPAEPAKLIAFASGFNGPVSVETGPDGSLYVLNRGTIWRDGKRFVPNSGSLIRIRYAGETKAALTNHPAPALAPNNPLGLPNDASALPKRWSTLKLEEKIRALSATGELLPYRVNTPEWHPGVRVKRMIALPHGARIRFSKQGNWQFPPGTVFLRSYSTSPGGGGSPSAGEFERRLVVIGDPRSYGASYRVTPDGADAELVEDGDMASLPSPPGKPRIWFFPPVDDALSFPTPNLAYALDVNTRQLNRTAPDGRNQLIEWNDRGLFEPPLGDHEFDALPKLADLADSSASPELRVRSYLDANCAICHQPGGAARAFFDARFHTPLDESGLLDGQLAAGDLGIAGARVIAPGHVDKSILYQRLKRHDLFRMPPVQFHNEFPPVLPVLESWIRSLNSATAAANP